MRLMQLLSLVGFMGQNLFAEFWRFYKQLISMYARDVYVNISYGYNG